MKVRYVGLSDVPAWYASRAQTIAQFRGYEPLAALQLEYSLAERNIENEFVSLGTEHGMGIMAWSPLAHGLLSGKYRPSGDSGAGAGRLEVLKDSSNPTLMKFSERNFAIVAELEAVAKLLDRSMAEVAPELGRKPAGSGVRDRWGNEAQAARAEHRRVVVRHPGRTAGAP